jgi:hypothetical protein
MIASFEDLPGDVKQDWMPGDGIEKISQGTQIPLIRRFFTALQYSHVGKRTWWPYKMKCFAVFQSGGS